MEALEAAPYVPIWYADVDVNEPDAFHPTQSNWVLHGEDLPLDGGDLVIFPSLWVPPGLAAALAAAGGPSAARPLSARGCLKGTRALAERTEAPTFGVLDPPLSSSAGPSEEVPQCVDGDRAADGAAGTPTVAAPPRAPHSWIDAANMAAPLSGGIRPWEADHAGGARDPVRRCA